MTIEAGRPRSPPQLNGTGLFVTDGGLETELTFHDGRHVAAIISAWSAN
jgi:hypothetical protein